MSVHLPPRPSRPLSRSTMRVSMIMSSVSAMPECRNDIPHIQDIEIINAFRDAVSDLKTVEEIAMKKPKTVVDLPAIADVCIEASEARARLLESRGKGTKKKG
jgi:hypothetical protein